MMWEIIRANRRKTGVLVIAMAAVLAVLGMAIGQTYMPDFGWVFGLMIAFAIWAVMSAVAYFQGDAILLRSAGAKKIEKEDHPQLFNVVEEMVIASGHGKMPDVYIINDPGMNAFAVGRDPDKAAVAITSGLLERLDRDELQGVMAHEMSHIVNRDVLLMSMVAVMLGAIVMLSEGFLRSLWYSGGRSRRYSSSRGKGKGGEGAAIVAVIAIVLAILAPILAQLIYYAVSRRREFLADACAAVYTRYPEGLASALEKLGGNKQPLARANKASAPMYIVNPFAKAKLSAWTATHPPLADRVKILRSIGGGVSFGAYQSAWQQVEGDKAGSIPKSALTDGTTEPVREATAEPKSPRDRLRETGDLLRKVNGFLFLPCACGAKLKLPPGFDQSSINCPHCNRNLVVPVAGLEGMADLADRIASPQGKQEPPPRTAKPKRGKAGKDAAPLVVERTPGEWQSFRCSCGATKSISPNFDLPATDCNRCGRAIKLK